MFRMVPNLLGSGLDRLVLRSLRVLGRRRTSHDIPFEDKLRFIESAAIPYADDKLVDHPSAFFQKHIAPNLRLKRLKPLESLIRIHGDIVDAFWPSDVDTFFAGIRERFVSDRANHHAHARLYLHREPHPAVILIHGYRMGAMSIEERLWPIRRWFSRGLDVALLSLPFHGVRKSMERYAFPCHDPAFNNEAFRQTVSDVQGLADWFRSRGSTSIHLVGMSLGAYCAALSATCLDDLFSIGMLIPLSSLADYARHHGELGDGRPADVLHGALERAYRVVLPYARVSRVPMNRILIAAAEGDNITPYSQAERLRAHFGGQLFRYAGSHLLQTGMREAYRALDTMWERDGILQK